MAKALSAGALKIYVHHRTRGKIHVATIHDNLRFRYDDRICTIAGELVSNLQWDGLEVTYQAIPKKVKV